MQVKPQLDTVLCTACHGCVSVCPKECITMIEDELGFLRPRIDEKACIECGLCEKTCDAVKKLPVCPEQTIYAARHISEDVVKNSASGGVFTALSDAVLRMGGAVAGARYAENMEVRHVIVRTAEERNDLRGSKYTYSLCDKTLFKQVRELLQAGPPVMFTGTPCQTSALKTFLGRTYDNLFAVDILCHGITAPVLYRDFIAGLEKKHGKIKYIDFRYSPDGNWHEPRTCVTYEKGGRKSGEAENAYFRMFVRNFCLRESCYKCNFASFNRVSDITLGDFWGIESRRPELDARHGVSVVTLNTAKGAGLFECAKADLHVDQCVRADCAHDQLNGLKPEGRNEAFLADYRSCGYDHVREKYVTTPLSILVREKLYRIKWVRSIRDKIKGE